ncbi:DNA polymerase III subunit chi [Pseudomonas alcaligenes]|uniref:DNA polymerase III subunit chi n=1 Tax=Aquipseudomonas alcaligenes TaxID=43263 RepID=A0ABR7RXV0_AQUAC|nr:DNA polymerase III subunit chi [Pseudomonas alcaligenes]MBC9249634.1 DNA polymerase III subunit chi [Pseudomonas alcaligenes]
MKVEFYVLSSATPEGRLRAACQLASKAWKAGLPVFLRGSDAAQCAELDQLLWQFRAESFIPHNLHEEEPQAPIVIGLDQLPAQSGGVLLNLHPQLSPHLAQFSRVIEIVNQEPQLLALCRENFRQYRQLGHDPQRVEL